MISEDSFLQYCDHVNRAMLPLGGGEYSHRNMPEF